MRITKISVKGLFGYLDHEIPLNQESRITIIHGPNGVGKTVLMRMVDGLFRYDYELLGSIPFLQLRIAFSTAEFMIIEKRKSEESISFRYENNNRKDFVPFNPVILNNEELAKTVADHNPPLNLKRVEVGSKSLWVHREEIEGFMDDFDLGQYLDRGRLFQWFYENESSTACDDFGKWISPFRKLPDWLNRIFNFANTNFIQTNRLLSTEYERAMISDNIERYGPQYATAIFFPNPTLAVENFSRRFSERLYSTHKRTANLMDVDELTRLKSGFDILRDIINERFLFKQLILRDFDLKYVAQNGAEVTFPELSSGEQQLFILTYQLLFETEPNTLVMIDEPEISMNVVWQRNFLKDLQRIVELRNFDILIATHSPQIIHDKWDWMVPLGEKVDD